MSAENQGREVEVVDLPLPEFKKYVEDRHLNVGVINSLILWFELLYNQCRDSKDKIIEIVNRGGKAKDDPFVVKTLNGLYAEMLKIEEKVVYLRERYNTLTKSGETPN